MSVRLRAVALAAGGVAGVFGMLVSLLAPIFSIPLILGALIQPRSPRPGRYLMWVGVLLLNFSLFYSIQFVFELFSGQSSGRGEIYFIAVPTAILIPWCWVELILDALRLRQTIRLTEPSSSPIDEGLVWLLAVCLSAWALPGIPRNLQAPPPDYPLSSFLINLAGSLPIQLAVIVFDIWLLKRATRRLRAR